MAPKFPFILFTTFFLFVHLNPVSATATTGVRGGYWFPGSIPVSNIESTLYTHLFAAFADLDPLTYTVNISFQNQPQFSTFTKIVQQKNPLVKTLLSIGGAGANGSAFAIMARDPIARRVFINSSVSLARSYGFNGLDLDWEFPSSGEEMKGFAQLVAEWRQLVAFEAFVSRTPMLILTAAVYYSPVYYTSSSAIYPIQAISNGLDWINVMAYDFYAPGWSAKSTGPPAALYNSDQMISVDSGIRAWIQQGLTPTKLVLGLPFYGYAWLLVDANQTGLYAPANGTDLPAGGAMTYGQINRFMAQWKGSTIDVFDANVVSEYCFNDTTWIGYDSGETIFGKVLYAKAKGLGGYFAWHVGGDDNWTLSTTASQTWGG